MRSHKFINSLLYLIIPLVAKESRANESNGGIKCFFALFIDKRYIFQVIHFKLFITESTSKVNRKFSRPSSSTPFIEVPINFQMSPFLYRCILQALGRPACIAMVCFALCGLHIINQFKSNI